MFVIVVMMVVVAMQVVMRMLVRAAVLMPVVVHVRRLRRIVEAVIMIVRGAVGMHMEMSAVFDSLAVYGRFTRATTAYITHSRSPQSV